MAEATKSTTPVVNLEKLDFGKWWTIQRKNNVPYGYYSPQFQVTVDPFALPEFKAWGPIHNAFLVGSGPQKLVKAPASHPIPIPKFPALEIQAGGSGLMMKNG